MRRRWVEYLQGNPRQSGFRPPAYRARTWPHQRTACGSRHVRRARAHGIGSGFPERRKDSVRRGLLQGTMQESVREFAEAWASAPLGLAFGYRDVLIDRQVCKSLTFAARQRPLHFERIYFPPGTESQYHAWIMRRQVAAATNLHLGALPIF